MPYILIIMMLSATAPSRVTNVQSIRFDNQKACINAMTEMKAVTNEVESGSPVAITVIFRCEPAKVD